MLMYVCAYVYKYICVCACECACAFETKPFTTQHSISPGGCSSSKKDSTARMSSKPHHMLPCLLLLALLFPASRADVGTAAQYGPPFIPTACYGNDVSEFPSSNYFAAASEGIWDNGAACGRQYLVRCLSAAVAGTCKAGQTIQIKIVDHAESAVSRPSSSGATMVLSATAFEAIANPSAHFINIEFQQL